MLKQNSLRAKDIAILVIATLVVALDQFTKLWIRSNLAIGESFPLGPLDIIHIENSGAAFGIFRGQSLPLAIISLIVAIALLYYIVFSPRRLELLENVPGTIVLGLILGGIVGNLIDRLRFGHVTDFIDPHFWPAFNVSDSAVTCGITLMVIMLLLSARPRPERA